MARRRIRWLSASLVAVLLLTQLATVAFSCAVEQPPLAAVNVQVMGDMPGCSQRVEPPVSGVISPSLCFAHCDQGSQAPSPSLVLDLYGSTLAQSGFWISSALGQDLISDSDQHGALDVPTTGWPPPYLTFLVLRN